ncbi:MAG TPA: c-type cytochrome [Flavisolibacter sp.]|nr:c-type cytochrome [Flavisolibacter sp.]
MKKITIIFSTAALVMAGALAACNSGGEPSANKEGLREQTIAISKDSLIRRGAHLVTIMGCNDCHTPMIMTPKGPARDSSYLLAGHPEKLPLAEYTPDLTKQWVLFSMSGTAMAGMWGVSFAANLTSDETGIGNWTEAQFLKAMREGKLKGMDNTRPMLPPMPWQAYAHASDEDLKAIFAYLKSTKPVENRVPSPVPPGQIAKIN